MSLVQPFGKGRHDHVQEASLAAANLPTCTIKQQNHTSHGET